MTCTVTLQELQLWLSVWITQRYGRDASLCKRRRCVKRATYSVCPFKALLWTCLIHFCWSALTGLSRHQPPCFCISSAGVFACHAEGSHICDITTLLKSWMQIIQIQTNAKSISQDNFMKVCKKMNIGCQAVAIRMMKMFTQWQFEISCHICNK